jgi:hypothetical protein
MKKKLKDFLLGFLAGMLVLMAFMYGPRYMVALGAKTEEVGKKLENYKKPVQETTKGLMMNL